MKVLFMLAAVLWGTAANAQYWRAMGRGTVGPTSVQTLYGDSVSNRLLAGGTFLHIMNMEDTVLAFGQAAWNGLRWDSLATRIQPYGGGEGAMQTYWFLRFEGSLYACGNFPLQLSDGEWTNNLAKLNETSQRWESLGCHIPASSGILTLVPKAPQSTLYATGYRDNAEAFCGLPPSNVFRYDGSAFHIWEPFDQITPNNGNYVGCIFNYRGFTYLTGSVRDPVGPGLIATFLRYNGSSWEHVPGWDTQSPIKEILIHNDTLYIAGAFRYATGGPGNLIARFDGNHWDDMGGGLAYVFNPYAGAALDLEWWHGDLLVSGFFNQAAGVPCSSIAKWNGHQWCTFPGDIRWQFNSQPDIIDMAIWRDSLYICGGINTIDGEPVRHVAQWIGGDAVAECSASVGITTVPAAGAALVVGTLGEGQWIVRFPDGNLWNLVAYDALGRSVGQWRSNGAAIIVDLGGHGSGMYLLRATAPGGPVHSTKVLMP